MVQNLYVLLSHWPTHDITQHNWEGFTYLVSLIFSTQMFVHQNWISANIFYCHKDNMLAIFCSNRVQFVISAIAESVDASDLENVVRFVSDFGSSKVDKTQTDAVVVHRSCIPVQVSPWVRTYPVNRKFVRCSQRQDKDKTQNMVSIVTWIANRNIRFHSTNWSTRNW